MCEFIFNSYNSLLSVNDLHSIISRHVNGLSYNYDWFYELTIVRWGGGCEYAVITELVFVM